jgi:hypothetical protein
VLYNKIKRCVEFLLMVKTFIEMVMNHCPHYICIYCYFLQYLRNKELFGLNFQTKTAKVILRSIFQKKLELLDLYFARDSTSKVSEQHHVLRQNQQICTSVLFSKFCMENSHIDRAIKLANWP